MQSGNPQSPVTREEWLHLLLMMLIPGYNIVKLVIVARDGAAHPVMANFARAALWMIAISFGLSIAGGMIRSLAGV